MSAITYMLVVLCVSQFPCSGYNINMRGSMSLEACQEAAKDDDAHRAFCVPEASAAERQTKAQIQVPPDPKP